MRCQATDMWRRRRTDGDSVQIRLGIMSRRLRIVAPAILSPLALALICSLFAIASPGAKLDLTISIVFGVGCNEWRFCCNERSAIASAVANTIPFATSAKFDRQQEQLTAKGWKEEEMPRTVFSAMILTSALAGSAVAQAPDAGCALPSEPKGIPAAIDAAVSGPADRDRACMKALFIPEARLMLVSLGADGASTYTLQTLDDWIAGVKARGHAKLQEKQLKFQVERYSNIAHLWSSYAFYSDGKQVARGINSIQAIQEPGGWRVTGIMVKAESATAPLPKEYLP